MTQIHYPYKLTTSTRYIFISLGKKRIEKVVDFIPLGIRNIINLGFGDLMPDGTIADRVNSNNGDLIKVLATVIDILKHFTTRYPQAIIYFRGSTNERTKLYGRILKTYYTLFSKEFTIIGIVGTRDDNQTVPFDPLADVEYLAFLIKRIS
jgi:hypothetical protein